MGYLLRSGTYNLLWFGTGSLGETLVRHRSHRYSLLGKAQEELSSATRTPSIETKREFVEVVVEVLFADRTLVRARQPAFQQRSRQMNSRQQFRGRFLLSLQKGYPVTVGNMAATDYLRPSAIKAGVVLEAGQRVGWHNLRHSLASFLVAEKDADVRTVQDVLRHSNSSTTIGIYSQSSP